VRCRTADAAGFFAAFVTEPAPFRRAVGVTRPLRFPPPGRARATHCANRPEVNSAGDIPDSQVLVPYRSSQGYSIKVPEGWARSEQPGSVCLSDKYNAVRIDVSARAAAPTPAEVRATWPPG
jgi:hypothetical protein